MADYQFKYRLQSAPQARNDGSGCLDHDVYALASEDGENWAIVPGRHKTISVPFEELDDALAQQTDPLRVAAYKDALATNLDNAPIPITGWTLAALLALMEANDATALTAVAADEFILSVWPSHQYPVDFAM